MKKTLLLSLSLSRFCSTLKTTAFTQALAIRSARPLKW
uniref:BabB n=3 Tax=Helicobacter pylori TaxID=210 RepID=A0A0N9EJC5_HELPX|nr:BabB [Helicobacter pylori]